MRDLIEDKSLSGWLTAIPARGTQTSLDIFAEASPLAYPAESQTNAWFELPVLEGLHTRLSASAVDTYERCGLQFKLDRDWRLVGEASGGNAVWSSHPSRPENLFRFGEPRTSQDGR